MTRPYARASIEELERLVDGDPNEEQLHVILDELNSRSTRRGRKLLLKIQERYRSLEVEGLSPTRDQTVTPTSIGSARPVRLGETGVSQVPPVASGPAEQYPPIENKPSEILSAWTSLEVLSPATFRKPEELAGDRTLVVPFDRSPLPWEQGAPSKPKYRLYYQIVLGSVYMEPAIAALIERYGDSRAERPGVRGNAALAVITIDQKGRLVDSPAVGVSSFGWGVSVALAGALSDLASWPQAEPDLTKAIESVLRPPSSRSEGDTEPPVVDRGVIERAYAKLTSILKLNPDWLERPSFAIKIYQYFRNPAVPDPLLLNSFFLNDLGLGRNLIKRREAPTNLLRYLGVDRPLEPLDLLKDDDALDEALAPKQTPLARWPANGRHPLVLLQQAAVNLTFANLASSGVMGINGPPGTGKTTLLRDIVADAVRRRADAMTRFDDPEKAFSTTGQRLKVGNGWIHLYALDSSLRGHEIVVASSNNKAVENVSAELPGINAIAADAEQLRYFPSLAQVLHGKASWGLIAAVLGNAKNRTHFRQTFWWDEDHGFNAYLTTINGASPQIESRDPITNEVSLRPPRIVQEEKPPADHPEALRRWKTVVAQYRERRAGVEKALTRLEDVRADVRELARLAMRVEELGSQIEALQPQIEHQRVALARLADEEHQAQLTLQRADRSHAAANAERPGFFARLFSTRSARAWRTAVESAEVSVATSRGDWARKEEALRAARSTLSELGIVQARLVDEKGRSNSDIALREVRLARTRASTRATIVDENFHSANHRIKQLSIAWLDHEVQLLRDELFVGAMRVHRAFVDAAARPLKHNIGALMNFFAGPAMPDVEKEKLRPSLWSSLFLAVPVVSTTFASVERMLGRLPPQALGWLLVDEAGQALPQAAVGAIIRSQRVVMVGDPVQIEPVVALPDKLSFAICRTFGIDPDRFAAPGASAQTLADSASSHASELQTREGSRPVGVPLLVHRRCAEPMFGVSNSVAYAGMMVSSKMPAASPIGDVLGPSRWIHIEGTGEDKWCEQEGDVVLDLVKALVAAKCELDLYIVTPFEIVERRLRQAILKSGVIDAIDNIDPSRWVLDRVGTVHTVQGREAEAVVFVLGAPLAQQRGARAWAGGKPNLLNVAVTRAKEVLYVVGNRTLWERAGVFRLLSAALPSAEVNNRTRDE